MDIPSLRFVQVGVYGEMRNSRTEFIRGRNSRSEHRDCHGFCEGDPRRPGAIQFRYGPLRAVIQNRDLQYSFHLDLQSRVYTATRTPDPWSLPQAQHSLSRRRTQPERSGRTIYVRTETRDTGERRQIFGYPARRVLIRTTHTFSPDTRTQSSFTEVDGWYTDPPPAWSVLHPPLRGHAILVAGPPAKLDTPVFVDDGPRETGFPLQLHRTIRSSSVDAEQRFQEITKVDTEEVTEISEADLDPGLFTPPRDFKEVKLLPGDLPVPFAMRWKLRWHRTRRALARW